MSNLINNIDELDKLKKSQYKTITKISFNNLVNADFVKLKNIAKLSNLIELDLSTNLELFNVIDNCAYQELAQQYDALETLLCTTLDNTNILSDYFSKHKKALIKTAKSLINITKEFKEQINDNKLMFKYNQLIFTNQTISIGG